MCGINLYIGEGSNHYVKWMNSKISHRGVRSNQFDFDNWSLGHIRLPIQDISTNSDQPFFHKKQIAAFVGEIFNFREFNPIAKTDLPIFLKLFETYKGKVSEYIDGFYSAIIYDKVSKLFEIIIDELGKKPLYIKIRKGKSLSISSEIKALIDPGELVDELYFSSVAKWGYYRGNRTPYQNIKRMESGMIYTINPVTKNILRKRPISLLKPNGCWMNTRRHIKEAVKNRLVSDIPVSILVSGGIDSTIIYNLIRKYTTDITVFHVENDEAEYLNYLNFKGVKVKQLYLEDISKKMAYYFNETPVDIGSVVPQYAMGAAIKEQGLQVAISGDGADELFGGYKRAYIYDSQLSDIFEELPFYHLPRLDKLMMANTVELRCPFLSRNVIQSAISMPRELRIDKQYLKSAFSDIVPKPIIERKKQPLRVTEMVQDREAFKLNNIRFFRKEILNEH